MYEDSRIGRSVRHSTIGIMQNGIRKFLGAESRFEDYKLTEKGFSFNLKINNNPLLKNL